MRVKVLKVFFKMIKTSIATKKFSKFLNPNGPNVSNTKLRIYEYLKSLNLTETDKETYFDSEGYLFIPSLFNKVQNRFFEDSKFLELYKEESEKNPIEVIVNFELYSTVHVEVNIGYMYISYYIDIRIDAVVDGMITENYFDSDFNVAYCPKSKTIEISDFYPQFWSKGFAGGSMVENCLIEFAKEINQNELIPHNIEKLITIPIEETLKFWNKLGYQPTILSEEKSSEIEFTQSILIPELEELTRPKKTNEPESDRENSFADFLKKYDLKIDNLIEELLIPKDSLMYIKYI
jgi:hypothetical protein